MGEARLWSQTGYGRMTGILWRDPVVTSRGNPAKSGLRPESRSTPSLRYGQSPVMVGDRYPVVTPRGNPAKSGTTVTRNGFPVTALPLPA